MAKILVSVGGGILGVAFLMIGTASSSAGYLKVFALPALALQQVNFNLETGLDDVQLNQGGVVVQFLVYFALFYLVTTVIKRKRKSSNNETEK